MEEKTVDTTEPKKDTQPKWVGLAIVGAAVALLVFIGVKNIYSGNSASITSSTSQKMIVLNTAKIIAASTKQIMDAKDVPSDKVSENTQTLVNNLRKIIDNYRTEGVLVLNSNSLIAWPDAMDETQKVADKLGVKIE